MFKPVPPKPNTTQMEDALVRFWKTWRIQQQCEEMRLGGGEYVYFEKPPSPSSKPDIPQIAARVFSDLFLRYKTMRGYHILRRSGWQAHGLPVELLAARQLGIGGKSQIEEYGIANFNRVCHNTLDYYGPYWERINDRLGYWVDPQEAYLTITNDYIESVWWAVKSLWDKGLLYQVLKVQPYCPSCGVHLSDHEIKQGGKNVNRSLICVRLPLVNGPGTSLLVMTKDSWSLTGNVAVAVNPEAEYITVEQEAPGGGLEHLVVAQKSVKKIFGEHPLKVVDTFKGKKLKGEAYFPLYKFILPQKTAYIVVVDNFVRDDVGTGIVHIAPSFNEQDLRIAQEFDLPLLNPVTDSGTFVPEVRPWSGKFVKDADPYIIQDLDVRGLLFKAETTIRSEPHCMYCGSPVLDFARNGWFIRISQYQDHLRDLIHQKNNYSSQHQNKADLEREIVQYSDKVLGYERFYGTPLPVWECQSCHHQVCIGSIEELSKLAGVKQTEIDFHRPFIDDMFLMCPECKGQLIRVFDLVHPWFENACMPFASWHYPFENQSIIGTQFPADLVCVDNDETDNWLLDLFAMNGILFEKNSYKDKFQFKPSIEGCKEDNEISQAENLSRVINEYGGDVFRWHLFDCWKPKEGKPASKKLLKEQSFIQTQKTISLIWSAYEFFINQTILDDWSPLDIPEKPEYKILDLWLRSELHKLILNVTTNFDFYQPQAVVTSIQKFITKVHNWYIPHSIYRVSNKKMDEDKAAVYTTMYEVLTTLCRLCAPVIPFLTEEMFQNLFGMDQSENPVSVHLADWPIADLSALDETLMTDMEKVMKLASLGRTARRTANIPLFQPLSEIDFLTEFGFRCLNNETFYELLKVELNVKEVKCIDSSNQAELSSTNIKYVLVSQDMDKAALVTQLTPELIDEGIARQVILRVISLRKQAGLRSNEHIRLYIKAAPILSEAIYRFRHAFSSEALVDEMSEPLGEKTALSQFEVNGKSLFIGIEKK